MDFYNVEENIQLNCFKLPPFYYRIKELKESEYLKGSQKSFTDWFNNLNLEERGAIHSSRLSQILKYSAIKSYNFLVKYINEIVRREKIWSD